MSEEKPLDKIMEKLASGKDATIQLIGDTTRRGCGCFDAYDHVTGTYERGRCERHADIGPYRKGTP